MKNHPSESRNRLTVPDLVVLSYLSERPRHGYELNQLFVQHDVKDWAGISRPQIYYSLNKLWKQGFIHPEDSTTKDTPGPERQVFRINPKGLKALTQALDKKTWATQRIPPPFLTWLALSRHTSKESAQKMINQRRSFLKTELEREEKTMQFFETIRSHEVTVAKFMVDLTIRQFKLELEWLGEIEREFTHR